MSAQPQPEVEEQPKKISVAEYHEMLRKSDVRLEYLDGEIIAMAGGSVPQGRIAKNITVALETSFDNEQCEAFVESIGVRTSSIRYRYPDVAALCGEPETDNANPPNLLNPQVIFEVLSPSTDAFDSNGKFEEYKQILTLRDYILIAQSQMLVSHYARQTSNQWIVTVYTNPDDRLVLAPLSISVSLAALYRRVEFLSLSPHSN